MLFAVWTGWGFLVPLLVGGAFVLTQLFGNALFGPYFYETSYTAKVFATLLSAVSIWYVGKHFNSKPSRTLVDKKTGEEIVIGPSNTFFFIKMEYWAAIVLGIALIVSFTS